MLMVYLRKDAILLEKGLSCMLKLAALLHNKIGIAIVGAVLLAGGGAAVATATGAHPICPWCPSLTNWPHNHGDDDATKTPGGVGEHQETHGVVASVNSAGASFVRSGPGW